MVAVTIRSLLNADQAGSSSSLLKRESASGIQLHESCYLCCDVRQIAVDAAVAIARLVVYWGDVDTHGFAILNNVRRDLPRAVSVLMDEETLLAHRSLWTTEQKQFGLSELSCLSPSERVVYQQLKNHTWGPNVRLEQERIAWSYAWSVLQNAVKTVGTALQHEVLR